MKPMLTSSSPFLLYSFGMTYNSFETTADFGIFNPTLGCSTISIFKNLSVAYRTTYFARVITPYLLPSAPLIISKLAVVVRLSFKNLIVIFVTFLYFFKSFLFNFITIFHSSLLIALYSGDPFSTLLPDEKCAEV